MKLLQINSTANWGSTGRIAEEIGLLAISQGWNSYISYGRHENIGKSHHIKIGYKWDIHNHVLQTRLFDRHGLASSKDTHKLIKEIEQIEPDIIHLHNIHGYYLNYEILFDYLAKTQIPVVWTLHDCWAFTGHCAYFSFAKCERWKSGCYDCPCKRDYPASLLFDNSRQNYKRKKIAFNSVKHLTLVPVSDWLANLVKESFLKEKKVRVIHNGINLNVFSPQTLSKSELNLEEKFTILGVASVWGKRKGLDDFIKLRNMLADEYQIVLIGLDAKLLKALPYGVIGIERTNSVQELAAYYSVSDVFLNPTYEDNYPTTNLEAMACGTPVITYRTGGSVEALDEGTGWIVEQGDLNAVVHVLPEVKKINRKKCRERAECFFNKDDCYAQYFQLYEELLNKR